MAAGAGQRGTRQGGLRGTGECRLFSKAGVQRGRELGKKRGLTEKRAQAVLVQAHLRQGLGSRAPGGTENPGVGPSAEPSPLPDPGEEGAPRLTSRYRTAGSACAGTPRRGPCSSTPSCRRQACQPPHWAPLDQVGLGLLRIPSQTAPTTTTPARPAARLPVASPVFQDLPVGLGLRQLKQPPPLLPLWAPGGARGPLGDGEPPGGRWMVRLSPCSPSRRPHPSAPAPSSRGEPSTTKTGPEIIALHQPVPQFPVARPQRGR